jgi:hypothetical protein
VDAVPALDVRHWLDRHSAGPGSDGVIREAGGVNKASEREETFHGWHIRMGDTNPCNGYMI